jgi:SNF2 family DNA or RNA helicase
LTKELREELDLAPGRRVRFTGIDAARFTERLRAFQLRRNDDLPRDWTRMSPLVPELSIENGRAILRFVAGGSGRDSDAVSVDAALVVAAWRERLGLVPLLDGGWAPLPTDWLERWGPTVADLLATQAETNGPTPVPLLTELCAALDRPPPAELERLRPLFSDFSELPRAELPADLRAELRSYQRVGVDWLCFLRDAELGAVLADDMGLGKTLQALCAVRGRTLIVAPRSVIHNWAAEIARFRPALRVSVFHGPNRALDPNADVTLTTYAVLRLDIERLAAEQWSIAILDEAQSIKNAESQVTRAAYRLQAKFRVSLTGTPIENRLEELWSQMHFANPGLLGGRRDFSERVAAGISSGNSELAERLRTRIRPFVLRRLKVDVAPELPPKSESILYVELDEAERSAYDAVHAATRERVMQELGAGRVLAALEALLRLRQAACHRALLPGQSADTSAKVERLLECLEEIASEGRRALVFSQWTGLLDLVEPWLQKAAIAFERLDGSTRDRAGVVARFQSDDGPPVLLASLKAGGTGLNLTAADHVFLLDPWWNPAAEDQAADRAHRIGQTRPVFVYRLVAKNTVEERILALQDRKRELVDLALEGAAQAITREDLLSLFD